MNKIIFVLLAFFQITLHAENLQTSVDPRQAESGPGIITPETGSQYNLDGKQGRDGQYKSAYTTKSVEKKNPPQLPSGPYATDGSIYPVVPVIIIDDE